MTLSKSDKLTKVLLAAAGVGVSAFLIVKYHKQIFNKFSRAKNLVLYDFAKIQRTSFDVHIVDDINDCTRAIRTLEEHCKDYAVLGFDCEWVTLNNERRKVALIQLCSDKGYCALFRVCKFTKIPLELRSILENPEILKVGVASTDDAKNLLQDYAINVNGAFDIRFLALLANHKAEGLGKLSSSVLGVELDKNWRIACSDWEIEPLNSQQVDYAAKDAFVAVEIFKKLYRQIRPGDANDAILRYCDKYTDVSFKNKLAQMNLDPAGSGSSSEKNLLKRQKDMNKLLKRAYCARSAPLYDNCIMQAPEGSVLCTCDKKKAEWYISKGLATEITREPTLTVRLNFEPAGRAVGETGEYYQTARENKCVVCGIEEHLIRKNVVPHEYRKFFPNVMKDKTSHDVLLLCVHCHQHSNISDLKVRQVLEAKCNAPIQERPINDDELKSFRVVQRAANALANKKQTIPEDRIVALRKVVQDAYPGDELTEEFIRGVVQQCEPPPLHKSSHGELVVEYFKSHEGIIALEKMYRQHFLDAMQPKHMPKLWDVNHNGSRLEIRAKENRVDLEDLIVAGIDEKIIQSMQPSIRVENTETNNASSKPPDEEFDDNMSMASFYSLAAGSAKMDRTDDERYFSDSAATMASFYETIRSEDSTSDLTEFQSFQNSREDLNGDDSDDASTIGSPDFPSSDDEDENDDTEVEEEDASKKL